MGQEKNKNYTNKQGNDPKDYLKTRLANFYSYNAQNVHG